jgi:hypothetical protein
MGLGLGVELTELSVSSFTLLLGSFSFLSLSLLCLCSCLCLCLCLCFFLSFFFFFNLPLSDLCFESPSFLNIPGSNPTGPLCPIPGSDTELSEKYSCLGVGLGGSICMSIGSSCITTLNPNETKHNANYYLHSVVARHHLHIHALQVVVDYYGVGGVFRGRRVFHLGGGELLGGVRSRFLRVLLVHVHHACQLGDGEAHRAAAAVQGVVDVHQVAAQSRVVGQHPAEKKSREDRRFSDPPTTTKSQATPFDRGFNSSLYY